MSEGGATLLRSEGYKARASCDAGIESVRNTVDAKRYDVKTASDGRPYFNLKSGNGQVIGTSPMFADQGTCDAAVMSVQVGAADAPVRDES